MASSLRFVPMTQAQYDVFHRRSGEQYVSEIMRIGVDSRTANEMMNQSFVTNLPKGLNTPGNYFFDLNDGGPASLGWLWIALKPGSTTTVYIYDIFLEEHARGRGLGKQVMAFIEESARELGAGAIALHVFEHNPVARKLYESSGYRATGTQMRKNLD